MIVEEKLIAIAIYTEVSMENPSKVPMKYPRRKVKIICPIPVMREILPTSFMTFGERCNPTIKRRKAIPNSENMPIASIPGRIPRKNGPAIIPEMMYPMMSGCFSILMIRETARTIRIIRLI